MRKDASIWLRYENVGVICDKITGTKSPTLLRSLLSGGATRRKNAIK